MSDRDRFQRLNELLRQGQALTALISPYANDERFWPSHAAQPWPHAYTAWYEACHAVLDSDLGDLFQQIDTGDWQRPGVRQVIDRLALPLTAPPEQVEAARAALRTATSQRPLWSLFTPQQEVIETARRRAFSPTNAIPARITQIVAAAQYRRQQENIDQLFISSGCERHWWVRPFQAYDLDTRWRVAGWFTAIQAYAPERERTIVRDVVRQVLRRGRLRGDKRPTLEQFLVESDVPIPVAASTSAAPTASCFISYSSADAALAERLYADLHARGVRCWYAPHSLTPGTYIVRGIDEAIRLHDMVVLLLSETAVQSHWVAHEVQAARTREAREGRILLYPLRLDDAVLTTNEGWAVGLREERHIGDFRRWKEHDAYQQLFAQLLADVQQRPQA